ncbi:MAG TPA: RNA 2',3'-cyclic phosphodiesterase [Alphaproteobacteria bacterium]|nr:RNA 2',3'-cyclic phosphodiesterase [Alphaproteobacteria bacterium]HAJ46293.1 RNA 2',3'-cyclic phosphodiesterase [Alphaproteobacteria bacterium]
MIRLFVALDIPEAVSDRLSLLETGIPGARWTPSDNLHLTLRFIGEVNEATARDIDDVLSTIRSAQFALSLSGLDTFGGRRPHALFIKTRPSTELVHLQAKVDNALHRLGLTLEARKFVPHVTLARLRDVPEAKLAAFIQSANLFDTGPFPVDGFCLFSSELGEEGSTYFIERRYPLQAA